MQRTLLTNRHGNSLNKLEKKLTKRLDKKFDRVNIYKDNYMNMMSLTVHKKNDRYFIDIYETGSNFILETKQESDILPRDESEYDVVFKTIENVISS